MQHTAAATTSCRSFSSPWTFSPLCRVSLRLILNWQALDFSLLSAKMTDIHQTSTASRSCFLFACWTHLSSYCTSSFQVHSHSSEWSYLMSPQSCSLFYILPPLHGTFKTIWILCDRFLSETLRGRHTIREHILVFLVAASVSSEHKVWTVC